MSARTALISISGSDDMPKLLVKVILFFLVIYLSDTVIAGLLKYGLEGCYGINSPVDIIFVGNSRVEAGIDPKVVSDRLKVPVAKFAIGGANTSDRLEMVKYWLSKRTTPVKCLVYGVDQYTFRNSRFKGGEDAYRHFYPFIDNCGVAEYVKQNTNSLEEYYLKKYIKLSRYNNQDKSLSLGYFLNKEEAHADGIVNLKNRNDVSRNLSDYTTSIDDEGITVFEGTLNYLSQKKIPVVLLYFSTTDVLNDLNGSRYRESISLLRAFAEKYKGTVQICEFTAEWSTRYDLYSDYSHLNRKGQVLASQLVSDFLEQKSSYSDFGRRDTTR
jgi:hypothetical protein